MSRLIDADELELDTEWSDYYDGFTSYSQGQIDEAEEVKAIPVERINQTMGDLAKKVIKYSGSGSEVMQSYCDGLKYSLAILSELFEEVEE